MIWNYFGKRTAGHASKGDRYVPKGKSKVSEILPQPSRNGTAETVVFYDKTYTPPPPTSEETTEAPP